MYRLQDPNLPPWVKVLLLKEPAGAGLPLALKAELERKRQALQQAASELQATREAAQAACGHPLESRLYLDIEANSRDVVGVVSCSECGKVLAERLDPLVWGSSEPSLDR